MSAYDALPFVSRPSPERHINRLAAVARLRGIEAASIAACSVLELGCGNGANLIPMALSLPASRFLGVDLAEGRIAEGQRHAAQCGANNVQLCCQSIADIAAEGEAFDYILCHGVFSWVPPAVRQQILALCAARLAGRGVACISYNALPGWGLRSVVREALRHAAVQDQSREEQLRAARRRLTSMLAAISDDHSPYATSLRHELENVARQSDAYILHELLAPDVQAFQLQEFLSAAGHCRLHFLGEARFSRNLTARLDELSLKTEDLAPFSAGSANVETLEQQLDFLFPTVLRSTLLACSTPPEPLFSNAAHLEQFYFASPLVPHDPFDGDPSEALEFVNPRGFHVEVNSQLMRNVLLILNDAWPKAVHFDELHRQSGKRLGRKAPSRSDLARELIPYCLKDLVEFFTEPPLLAAAIAPCPRLSPYARLQLNQQDWATSQRHDYRPFNDFQKEAACLLDGTRTREQIADALLARLASGALDVREDGGKVADPARLKELVALELDTTLKELLDGGFLLPDENEAGESQRSWKFWKRG